MHCLVGVWKQQHPFYWSNCGFVQGIYLECDPPERLVLLPQVVREPQSVEEMRAYVALLACTMKVLLPDELIGSGAQWPPVHSGQVGFHGPGKMGGARGEGYSIPAACSSLQLR